MLAGNNASVLGNAIRGGAVAFGSGQLDLFACTFQNDTCLLPPYTVIPVASDEDLLFCTLVCAD